MLRKYITKCAVLSATALFSAAAIAYPDKPVTVVMAWGAGGATDVLARAIQPAWSKNLGAEIVIKMSLVLVERLAQPKPQQQNQMVTRLS